MEKKIQIYNTIAAIIIFVCFPLLLWAVGDFPRRTLLKEVVSLLSIIAFSLMLGQFFLVRSNRNILDGHKMAGFLKIHKFIGYFFIPVLFLHPLLIVFPRYFESGISPVDAFVIMISNYDKTGIFLGMLAYLLMLILGLTSLFRKRLNFKYSTWRLIHGCLSIAFIIVAVWHVLIQGRHMNLPMSVLILTLAAAGVGLLLKTYMFELIKK
ncbi:MAG: ferric reductase-like transmembrane domain-containing protein [Bacteroidales bacterium]|nr:ferric reductase-like transmembrane domain-containing protein [Bacteroidales bacterium]